MTVELVEPADLTAEESTPGIVREPIFETDAVVMARSRVEADTTTGWHHHGDRHAFGYLIEGSGEIEYAADGVESRELSAPLYFHVGAGTVHRETAGTEMTVLVAFVGSGPVVENVDAPDGT